MWVSGWMGGFGCGYGCVCFGGCGCGQTSLAASLSLNNCIKVNFLRAGGVLCLIFHIKR